MAADVGDKLWGTVRSTLSTTTTQSSVCPSLDLLAAVLDELTSFL